MAGRLNIILLFTASPEFITQGSSFPLSPSNTRRTDPGHPSGSICEGYTMNFCRDGIDDRSPLRARRDTVKREGSERKGDHTSFLLAEGVS